LFKNLRLHIAVVRSAWRQPNISKHTSTVSCDLGIKNFPKYAVYDIADGLILIFAQRTGLQSVKTGLGNILGTTAQVKIKWVSRQTIRIRWNRRSLLLVLIAICIGDATQKYRKKRMLQNALYSKFR